MYNYDCSGINDGHDGIIFEKDLRLHSTVQTLIITRCRRCVRCNVRNFIMNGIRALNFNCAHVRTEPRRDENIDLRAVIG